MIPVDAPANGIGNLALALILFDGGLRTHGKAWLAQIVMFIMRGLLGVAQPTEASRWAAGGRRAG